MHLRRSIAFSPLFLAALVACSSTDGATPNAADPQDGGAPKDGGKGKPDGGDIKSDGSVGDDDDDDDDDDDAAPPPPKPSASVLQHHNHINRDGFFIDPKLTKAAAATMHNDSAFAPPT